jgi:hypothetical protein
LKQCDDNLRERYVNSINLYIHLYFIELLFQTSQRELDSMRSWSKILTIFT